MKPEIGGFFYVSNHSFVCDFQIKVLNSTKAQTYHCHLALQFIHPSHDHRQ